MVKPGPQTIVYVVDQLSDLYSRLLFQELRYLRDRGFEILCVPADDYPAPHPASTSTALDQEDGFNAELGSGPSPLRANLAVLFRIGLNEYWKVRRTTRHHLHGRPPSHFFTMAAQADRLWHRGAVHFHARGSGRAIFLAATLATLTGSRYSFAVHSEELEQRPALLLQMLRSASFAITASDQVRDQLIHLGGQEIASRLHAIYPIFQPEQPQYPSAARERLSILAIGPLMEQSGFLYLVEACRILKARGLPFRCRIAGYGAQRELLSEIAQASGLARESCAITELNPAQISSMLAESSVLVDPSSAAVKGYDLLTLPVLLQAMAQQIPVIVSQRPHREAVVQQGAALVRPNHPEALADALTQVAGVGADHRAVLGQTAEAVTAIMQHRMDTLANLFQAELPRPKKGAKRVHKFNA